jgi:molybdate transport system substrate-binding protein
MNKPALRFLCSGAAQGLVRGLKPEFEARGSCTLDGHFGAGRAMRDRLFAGAPCDVVILSQSLVHELADQGHVLAHTAREVGVVKIGLAVPDGAPLAGVTSGLGLKALLERAAGIYIPDPATATAGIHFMRILRELKLAERLAGRLHAFPDGPTAMAEMARAGERGAVGCTRVSEILYAPGVQLVGWLPPPYELATTYAAAVCTRAEEPLLAQAFIDLLTCESARPLREVGGFDAA